MLKKEAIFGIENYTEKNFEKLLYCFKYEGNIRKLIINYKFNEKSYLYKTFVNFLLKNEKWFEILRTCDTIIPIPISNKRNKERGYNQSLLIAKELSKNLKIPVTNRCLYKTKNTIEQSKLNKNEREKNIHGVYELKNKEIIKNKNILLIDDIYTTGNTVNEASKILKSANIKNIIVLVIAKD